MFEPRIRFRIPHTPIRVHHAVTTIQSWNKIWRLYTKEKNMKNTHLHTNNTIHEFAKQYQYTPSPRKMYMYTPWASSHSPTLLLLSWIRYHKINISDHFSTQSLTSSLVTSSVWYQFITWIKALQRNKIHNNIPSSMKTRQTTPFWYQVWHFHNHQLQVFCVLTFIHVIFMGTFWHDMNDACRLKFALLDIIMKEENSQIISSSRCNIFVITNWKYVWKPTIAWF